MAIVQQQQQDQEQQAAQAGQPISVSGGPVGGVAAGGMGGVGAPAPSGKTPGSGRFVNLQRYLQASRGGGQQIAGKIGEKVGTEAEKLGGAVEEAKGVQTQIESEKQRIAQAGGFAQQLAQDPTKLLEQKDAFTQLRTGQTALPGIQQQAQRSFDVAQSQLGNVQRLAQQTGTEAGRFGLLQQTLGRPSYSRGQQRLDQLLVQAEGGDVLGQLQKGTAAKAQAGEQLLGTARGQIQAGIGEVGAQAKTAQEQLMKALGRIDDPTTPENEAAGEGGGAFGGLQEALRGQQKQFISQQQALADRYRVKEGEQNVLDQELMDKLGIKAGQRLYGVNLNELIRPEFQAASVTEQSVATPEQLARYQALSQLAGQPEDYLRKEQAGTAQGVNVDASRRAIQDALKFGEERATETIKTLGETAFLDQGGFQGGYDQLRSLSRSLLPEMERQAAEGLKEGETAIGQNLQRGVEQLRASGLLGEEAFGGTEQTLQQAMKNRAALEDLYHNVFTGSMATPQMRYGLEHLLARTKTYEDIVNPNRTLQARAPVVPAGGS